MNGPTSTPEGGQPPIATASADAPSGRAPAPAEARQRWRLTFAREPVTSDQVGQAALESWQRALAASGLPIAGLEPGGPGRARIVFAAPLSAAAGGDAELADLWFLERRPLWAVREALADRLPAAHRWGSAEDIWLGAPALPGRVVAADWRIEIAMTAVDDGRLASAARRLLDARSLPRVRHKGATEKRYDLRPMIDGISLGPASVGESSGARSDAPPNMIARVRTRFHPELGAGRPEDVIAALGEAAGRPVEIVGLTRRRLILADGSESGRPAG